MMLLLSCLLSLSLTTPPTTALLYPRDSPSRTSKSLDGVWSLKLTPKEDQEAGFRQSWFMKPLETFGMTSHLTLSLS